MHSRFRTFVVVSASSLSLLLTGCSSAAEGPPEQLARQRLEQWVARGDVPGIQYIVLNRDGVVFEHAGGMRDVATGMAMDHHALQMTYSTTKILTVIATLQLVEAGRLALDAPVTQYFSDHPYGTEVTVRQLLAHTSGVPGPAPLDWFALDGAPFDRHERLQTLLAAHPKLDHPPGARYTYSNLSYWMLEEVIEAASGQDFADYVREHVFAPLFVLDESATFSLPQRPATSIGHVARWAPMTLVLRALTPGDYWGDSTGSWTQTQRVQPYGRAYGGLFATASAYAAVLGDLLREQPVLLSAAARDSMWLPEQIGGRVSSEALGWNLGDVHGVRYAGKPGGGLGFHGNVRVYPERGLATVFLANTTEVSAAPINARSDELDAFFLAGPP
jgi:D-alanyl-D-alanine carboxypeptidase